MQMKTEPGMSHVVHEGEGKRFDVLGAHLVWKARGEDTDGTFTVAVQTLAPSEHIPLHKHQYPEVFYVTSGELIFTFTRGSEQVDEKVTQGGTVVVAANSYHCVRNDSNENATLIDIACFEHQQFFDDVQDAHQSWEGLTPEQTLQEVGAIGLKHTLEFRAPE
jgi:quercetin dioxygenase-like cupin family protein